MRTIRPRRLAVLFAVALGLFMVATPPAQALTLATFFFQGTANLDAPLGYPCGGAMSITTSKCATPVLAPDLNKPLSVTGGNTVAVQAFSTSVCMGGGTYQNHPVDSTAPCWITNGGSGTITGACGLLSGLVVLSLSFSARTLTVTTTFPPPTPPTVTLGFAVVLLNLLVHWVAVGPWWVFTGLADTGQRVTGVVNAVPSGNPGTSDNSCTHKTARNFELQGFLSLDGL